MEIVFYDPETPLAYDLATLEQQGLGGTEATVIRIAHALKKFYKIYIAQHCRQKDEVIDDVHYISFASAEKIKPTHVVLLRQYRSVEAVAELYPQAKKFLWLHNMPSAGLYEQRKALNQFEIIAVSNFHREAIRKRLKGKWWQAAFNDNNQIPIHTIYNPIAALEPNDTPYNPHQLIFTSSPHKGLAQTLKIFTKLRHYFPEYSLLIANPGYAAMNITLPPQACFLGVLPHHQLIQHLRESFCVFYPQQERMETFGLVYAEANAVGTPVLAHDFGAASEVLSNPNQLVNAKNFSEILNKIEEWRVQRPVLQARKEFALERVAQEWRYLINEQRF
ncbi:MAG TPA: glycosyltransferase [Gammaproteobacteria bacterium]|nr:glycosyltransferase [Gammaproteobacteria bacterium]